VESPATRNKFVIVSNATQMLKTRGQRGEIPARNRDGDHTLGSLERTLKSSDHLRIQSDA